MHMLEALEAQISRDRIVREAYRALDKAWTDSALSLLTDCRDSYALSPTLHDRVSSFIEANQDR